MKLYAVKSNTIPKYVDALYMVLEDDADLPQEGDDVEVDAVDLLPKNYQECTEVLFIKTNAIKTKGQKEANIEIHHVNSYDDIVHGPHGLYIVDDTDK